MSFWIKDGKLVIDETGALVWCEDCPCEETGPDIQIIEHTYEYLLETSVDPTNIEHTYEYLLETAISAVTIEHTYEFVDVTVTTL